MDASIMVSLIPAAWAFLAACAGPGLSPRAMLARGNTRAICRKATCQVVLCILGLMCVIHLNVYQACKQEFDCLTFTAACAIHMGLSESLPRAATTTCNTTNKSQFSTQKSSRFYTKSVSLTCFPIQAPYLSSKVSKLHRPQ